VEVVIVRGRAVWCVSLKGGRNFVFVSCAGLSLAGDWLNFAWPPLLQISNTSHAPHSHSRQPNYLRDRHTASHAKTGRISKYRQCGSSRRGARIFATSVSPSLDGESTFEERSKIKEIVKPLCSTLEIQYSTYIQQLVFNR
jgi:hypothetical protein